MRRDFFPDREDEMLRFTANLSANVLKDPGAYGVPLDRALAYAEVQERFSIAYGRAINPSTRGVSTVAAKNTARRQIERETRDLAKWIGGQSTVSDEQLIGLGLNVRKRQTPRTAKPRNAPQVTVLSVQANRVTIRLSDPERLFSRSRPDDASGAVIFVAIHDTARNKPGRFQFAKQSTRTRVEIDLPTDLPAFSQVWIYALWQGHRGQSGRKGEAVSTHLGAGVRKPAKRIVRAA